MLGEVGLSLVDARGAVASRDIAAPHPLPRFANSAMDGYAVKREDVAGASDSVPVELELIGEVRAGTVGEAAVRSGQTVRILTGAPLPSGADAVVPVEDTSESGDRVTIVAAPPDHGHVRVAGDDIEQGMIAVPAGAELGAGELALLASLGIDEVFVHRSPVVAVITSGDELVPLDTEPGPGQIRDSNLLALESLVVEAGGLVRSYPRVPDDLDEVRETLEKAATDADLVVATGGVSVGKYDYVKEAVQSIGSLHLWRVAMQPGKPVAAGTIGDTLFMGLPGNPVSVHVSFEQFVRPVIRKMRGATSLVRPVIEARLTDPIDKHPGRLHFVRVRLERGEDGYLATPTGKQGSHIQSSLVDIDGVARFPIDAVHLDAGAVVDVEVWRLPT